MRLTVTSTGAGQLIRSYADGVLRIGDQHFDRAVMVGPALLDGNLPVQNPLDLQEQHLGAVFAAPPELVVIGWVGGQLFLPAQRRSWFLERRIGLEVMELGAACRTYNVLLQDERRVIALLFPYR